MKYALEHDSEFERLEKQSTYPKYDYKKELAQFNPPLSGRVLDAGCGSGVICRYLANQYPGLEVAGCDFSSERIDAARKFAQDFGNISFGVENLKELSFGDNSFDAIICRYVLEHLDPETRAQALMEMHRTLKDGGRLYAIDFDGPLFNLYPQPPLVQEVLSKIAADSRMDLFVGRKMPALLHNAGFVDIDWRIETIECRGVAMQHEHELWPEKFKASYQFLLSITGSKEKTDRFIKEYLEALRHPALTLFYNKFIVTGKKKTRKLTMVENT